MIWAIGLFAIGFCIQYWPTLRSQFDHIPGDWIDGRMNNLVLENFHLFLSGKIDLHTHLNPPFFYPMKDVIGWTDTLWGTGFIYSFFRFIGLDYAHSFTGWIMVCSALNFWAAFWVFKKYFDLKSLGAALGAFLFAFSCARTAQIGHPQLFPAFATPLYFGWLYLATKEAPRLRTQYLALAAVALVFQIYAGFYLGWFLVLTTSIGLIPLFISKTARNQIFKMIRMHLKPIAIIAGASAIALIPQLIPFLKAAKVFGPRPYSSVRVTYPQLSSFFNMGPDHWLEGWVGHLTKADLLPLAIEHQIGIGLLTSLCVVLSLRTRVVKKSLPALLSKRLLSWTLLFSFGIGFASLWALIYLIFPGGSAIRAVGRVILILIFFAAIPLGAWVQGLSRKWQWAVVLVIVLEAVTSPMSHSRTEGLAQIKIIESKIPEDCSVFYVYGAPGGAASERLQIDAMWIAYAKGIKTVNGYSGNQPSQWNLSPGSLENLKKWQHLQAFNLPEKCIIHL